MKSLTLNVPRAGLYLKIAATGDNDAQIVIVAPDHVQVTEAALPRARQDDVGGTSRAPETPRHVAGIITANGFPPRELTEQAIIQIAREHGGSVKIRDQATGWNIYDEIAARLGVSIEARRSLTAGTHEPAWRPEVGFVRKTLEQQHILQPTEQRGRGIWALTSNG